MTSANKQQFDSAGNSTGTIADHIKSAAELLEIGYTVGEVNIFGDVETPESISGHIAANKVKAAAILEKAIKALRE